MHLPQRPPRSSSSSLLSLQSLQSGLALLQIVPNIIHGPQAARRMVEFVLKLLHLIFQACQFHRVRVIAILVLAVVGRSILLLLMLLSLLLFRVDLGLQKSSILIMPQGKACHLLQQRVVVAVLLLFLLLLVFLYGRIVVVHAVVTRLGLRC